MKKAFTMIELVFVIVIIGILSAIVLQRTDSNSLREAALQIISHIRYTQHLAMVNDQYDVNDKDWYKERWQLIYGKSNTNTRNTGGYWAYTIFSDSAGNSTGKPDTSEMAKNPLDKSKYLSGGYSGTLDWENPEASKKLNIGYSYGITNIKQKGCGGKRISFDHLGRPIKGNDKSWKSSVDGVLKKRCTFTIYKETKKIHIHIEPETGYVHIG